MPELCTIVRGFIEGAGMIVGAGAELSRLPPVKTDFEAIRDDWKAIGRDMRDAIGAVSLGKKSK